MNRDVVDEVIGLMKGFLTRDEIERIGFKKVDREVQISTKACFYQPEKISIGEGSRIDDFCILIGNIKIGKYVHIAGYSTIHASAGSVVVDDFSTLSSRVCIYSASDDYSGKYMTSPLFGKEYTSTIFSDVRLGKYVVVGTGSSILPNAEIPDGVAVGAMSLVKHTLEPWGIYAGIPARYIKAREKGLLKLAEEFVKGKQQ